MEILLLMAVGACAFAGSLTLLSGGGGDVLHSGGRVAFLASRRLSRIMRRLAGTRVVACVLVTGVGARMVREARSWPHLAALGREEAAAALLAGLALAACASGVLFLTPLAGLVVGGALCALVVARDEARQRGKRREVLAEMPGVYRTLAVAMSSGQTLAQALAEMPGVYRTLAVAMSSGQTLAQAVEYVGAHERGPAADVFARMSLRLRCGVATEDAVSSLAEELDVPGARLLATALVISHRTGSPLRDLLLRSARIAERQGEFERMLVVKTAQVRLSVRIVCLLPVAMVGLLTLMSPDFQQGLLTPSGVGCVCAAMLLDGLALFLIRRMMAGVV